MKYLLFRNNILVILFLYMNKHIYLYFYFTCLKKKNNNNDVPKYYILLFDYRVNKKNYFKLKIRLYSM